MGPHRPLRRRELPVRPVRRGGRELRVARRRGPARVAVAGRAAERRWLDDAVHVRVEVHARLAVSGVAAPAPRARRVRASRRHRVTGAAPDLRRAAGPVGREVDPLRRGPRVRRAVAVHGAAPARPIPARRAADDGEPRERDRGRRGRRPRHEIDVPRVERARRQHVTGRAGHRPPQRAAAEVSRVRADPHGVRLVAPDRPRRRARRVVPAAVAHHAVPAPGRDAGRELRLVAPRARDAGEPAVERRAVTGLARGEPAVRREGVELRAARVHPGAHVPAADRHVAVEVAPGRRRDHLPVRGHRVRVADAARREVAPDRGVRPGGRQPVAGAAGVRPRRRPHGRVRGGVGAVAIRGGARRGRRVPARVAAGRDPRGVGALVARDRGRAVEVARVVDVRVPSMAEDAAQRRGQRRRVHVPPVCPDPDRGDRGPPADVGRRGSPRIARLPVAAVAGGRPRLAAEVAVGAGHVGHRRGPPDGVAAVAGQRRERRRDPVERVAGRRRPSGRMSRGAVHLPETVEMRAVHADGARGVHGVRVAHRADGVRRSRGHRGVARALPGARGVEVTGAAVRLVLAGPGPEGRVREVAARKAPVAVHGGARVRAARVVGGGRRPVARRARPPHQPRLPVHVAQVAGRGHGVTRVALDAGAHVRRVRADAGARGVAAAVRVEGRHSARVRAVASSTRRDPRALRGDLPRSARGEGHRGRDGCEAGEWPFGVAV